MKTAVVWSLEWRFLDLSITYLLCQEPILSAVKRGQGVCNYWEQLCPKLTSVIDHIGHLEKPHYSSSLRSSCYLADPNRGITGLLWLVHQSSTLIMQCLRLLGTALWCYWSCWHSVYWVHILWHSPFSFVSNTAFVTSFSSPCDIIRDPFSFYTQHLPSSLNITICNTKAPSGTVDNVCDQM